MPPASTYSRQATESESRLVMDCKVKRECDVDWELPADSESCRSKMLAEYEARTGKSRQKRPLSRVPLWYFLHEVLHVEKCSSLICWEDKENLVFTIRKPKEIANLWGQIKKKGTMTYAKLARGIRYYYGKGVIEKACGKRFSYRFIVSNKTKAVLVGSGSADDFTEGEPASTRCYARSRLSGGVSCERPGVAGRPADGAAVPTPAASCRDRSSSTDSNDMAGSCMSSGDSTSGEDESISELDLFDYDRLLREMLMGSDDDMNRASLDGKSDATSNSEHDFLADDVEMSESKVDASAMVKSEANVAASLDASFSLVGGRRALNRIKQNTTTSDASPGNIAPSRGQETSGFSMATRVSCRSRPGDEVAAASVATPPGNYLSTPNGLIETSVSPLVMPRDQCRSVEYSAGAGALRQVSLDLNEAMTSGFLRMTQNELAQEYDPLLFDDIFADNAL